MFIGWPLNVKQEILDSTNITVGDGAVVEDALESGGQKKRRVVNASPSDKYSVTMEFDFVTKGDDGLTELERFYMWYKYKHCYGTNPFQFPAILINSNRQQGVSQEELANIVERIRNGDTSARLPDYEYYKITSAVEGSKSGYCLQLNMTWETYATGSFTIPEEDVSVSHIEAENGYVDIYLTGTPSTAPTPSTWTLLIDGSAVTVTSLVFDGDSTVRYYFEPLISVGSHIAQIENQTSQFEVA